MEVDYNYNEPDEKSAIDKITTASAKYDRSAPGYNNNNYNFY